MEKSTKLPDTNAILRYLLRDNPEQYELSSKFFENVRKGKARAIILECVLVESLYVLTRFYKVPRKEATDVLSSLLLYKGIRNSDKETLIRALAIYAGKSLDIVDCVLLANSKQPKTSIFSFDKDLKKFDRQL